MTRPSTRFSGPHSALYRDVLIGRGVGKQRDLAKAGFTDPRSRPIDEGELPDRRVDHPLRHDLLDLVQDRLPLCAVHLDRLLAIQLVDIWVAAIGEHAALGEMRLD